MGVAHRDSDTVAPLGVWWFDDRLRHHYVVDDDAQKGVTIGSPSHLISGGRTTPTRRLSTSGPNYATSSDPPRFTATGGRPSISMTILANGSKGRSVAG